MTENLRLGDILSLATLKENLAQVVSELTQTENYKKVVVLKDKPAVALVSAEEYRAAQEYLTEYDKEEGPFSGIIIDRFSVRDLLDEATLTANLEELLEQVYLHHKMKVLLKNDTPAIVLVNAADYEPIEQRLFAIYLEQQLQEMLEEEKRGELIDLDDLAAEFGITLDGNYPEPEGYEDMIPEKYRNIS